MTPQEFDKRLDELEVEFLHGVPVKLPLKAKQAIRELFVEVVGEDSYWYIDEDGKKQTNQFNDTNNGLRQQLRTTITGKEE